MRIFMLNIAPKSYNMAVATVLILVLKILCFECQQLARQKT